MHKKPSTQVSLVTGMNVAGVVGIGSTGASGSVGTKGKGAINSGCGSRVGRAIGSGPPQ